MTTALKKEALIKAHGITPSGMLFFNTLEGVRQDENLLGSISVIERAWKEMKLDGVVCLDSRPILYLKIHGRPFSPHERVRLQRLFWNQGVANILVLIDPITVYIYSGLTEPQNEQPDQDVAENALVTTLSPVEYARQIQELYHSLASGHYYKTNRNYFQPDQTVDAWLLDNLRALRNSLISGDEGLNIRDAHAFIGRVLFLCYLLDRRIVSVGQPDRDRTPTMQLSDILGGHSTYESRVNDLYRLFHDLKQQFNGNMFDQDLEVEQHSIRPEHLKKLILFLGGDEVESGQRSLGFWPYNFKMIPVETISAIYEDFLTTEAPEKQRGRGAFYTPRFLAEMVVDTAVRDDPGLLDGSFLDPACGSGIFLVILFNRLANRWVHSQSKPPDYVTKAKALQNILSSQIRGVDVEETACRIACFSLYLAYLDFFDPPDIQKHVNKTGRPLPKLLDYGDEPNRPNADISVINHADFFVEGPLRNQTFNCIIGNPPWKGRGKKQLAQKYLQETPRFLKKEGTGCLLLPTKILQNQTDTFQSEWLKRVSLESVLQLADYSFLLFQNALCPAFIARFKNSPPATHHLIEFSAPKFDRTGLRKGIITITPSARTWLPLSEILEATQTQIAPVVWKRRLWGTPRDQKLLDMLQSMPALSNLAGSPKEGKRWIKGQGFQPNTKGKSTAPKLPWWNKTDLLINARASCWRSKCIQLFKEDCEEIGERFQSLHRTRDKRIYKAPMVLVSQGFGKVAYCDFDILFQHSLQSIAGPEDDADLLSFLTVFLRSKLARYFLFHTSANWGTERDKVHLNELLRIPFPLPGDSFASPDAETIVKQISQKFKSIHTRLIKAFNHLKATAKPRDLFGTDKTSIDKEWRRIRKSEVKALQEELEPLIYRYFGLTDQEIALVQDTIEVFEPSSTPHTWDSPQTVTLDPVDNSSVEPYATHGIATYANTLTRTLNTWAEIEGADLRVRAEGGTDRRTGLATVIVSLTNNEVAFQRKRFHQGFAKKLSRFHKLFSKDRGTFIYHRDIFLFKDKQIHIVRPDILLNWTRTAALNDAARIYGEIVQFSEGF